MAASADGLEGSVLERTIELAAVPAPTGLERDRAHVVAGWWRWDGWADVAIDPIGNVRARVGDPRGPAVVLAAHLDTVFDEGQPHGARRVGDRLIGPSVGDDSVGVAALSAVGSLLAKAGMGALLVATVGEEGVGNLRGIRGLLDDPPDGGIRALLAVEGNYYGRVSTVGVGSTRWRIQLSGPGGHAWEASEMPSAVHAVARLTSALADVRHAHARTSVNVGRIAGGEAINARARSAWLEVDLRADEAIALEVVEREARLAIERCIPNDLHVEVVEIGRRPAGSIDARHPLVRAAVDALRVAGSVPSMDATSTDANAAHAAGIPAIAVGVTSGSGEHTPDEWIAVPPIALGVTTLADTVIRFSETS